jgi:hypothetical protein
MYLSVVVQSFALTQVSLTRGNEQEFGFALHGDSPSCVIGIEDGKVEKFLSVSFGV